MAVRALPLSGPAPNVAFATSRPAKCHHPMSLLSRCTTRPAPQSDRLQNNLVLPTLTQTDTAHQSHPTLLLQVAGGRTSANDTTAVDGARALPAWQNIAQSSEALIGREWVAWQLPGGGQALLDRPEWTRDPQVLAPSQSIWAHQAGEPGLFPAPKLTALYHGPSMST